MPKPTPEPIPEPVDAAPGLEADKRLGRWPALLGGALTIAMVAGVIWQLAGSGLSGFASAVPTSPGFYLCFVALYMAPQVSDYLIFRRLWGLPLAGLAALTGKRIVNEVVLGYAGDAWFYAWARGRARAIRSPFGAVKDVTILSAMAGNLVTLAALLLALPFAIPLLNATEVKGVVASVGIVVATSLPFVIFGRKVFTLDRRMLGWIFAMQTGRLLTTNGLLALAWAFEMPHEAVGTWLMLAAARMLVSRLPFIPNKDLVFANITILLIGHGHGAGHETGQALSDLVAFTAALTLAFHAAGMVAFGLYRLWTGRPWSAADPA